MPVHDKFFKPDFAAELSRFLETHSPVDLVVGIASNSDSIAGTLLSIQPKSALLLRTADLPRIPFQEIRAWQTQWPGPGAAPVIREYPEEGQTGLTEPEILPTLVQQTISVNPRRIGYLITGGSKVHAALLVRHAQVAGSRILHFQAEYTADGLPIAGTGRLMELPEPQEVIRREGLRRSREMVASGAFDSARRILEELDPYPDTDQLVRITRLWVDACRLRDALLPAEAGDLATRIEQSIDALGRPVNQTPCHQALRQAAVKLQAICHELSATMTGSIDWDNRHRLPLLTELLIRASQERAAGRRNHAALLYYRLAEACLTERLRVDYGIACDSRVESPDDRLPARTPAGSAIPADTDGLLAAYQEACRQLGLPALELIHPLALMAKYALLVALGDPALPLNPISIGVRLRELGVNRNQSIFAHGFEPVSPDDLDELGQIVGIPKPETGLLNLCLPDGPSRGHFNQKCKEYSGPVLNADGDGLINRKQNC